ncbi:MULTISPECIES: winged helix-turn-helix domain-containing protein [Haloferax]|uniref:Helix-turn-helix domain-containing protein n=2 Tax=Haloferax TaxID=2251 RepID=A0A6G1Z5A7_9EURY|nr:MULTISPECIES: winged helix-turn-helix domain-containing protein [Haloferax]KAB1188863.1 winged helix-turn-helix transcriptional regulator [Haloferax sp. CBA1149]MRW81581.1 helix-turn-helix domain-containing protein [Haloferax marinisediminis]
MDGSVASTELLDVLGDTESRALLVALRRESQSAKELGETVNLSLPTVYRRLDRLGEHGLVASTTEVRSDGTHYRQYECTFDQTTVSLSADGFCVDLSVDEVRPGGEQARETTIGRSPPADE